MSCDSARSHEGQSSGSNRPSASAHRVQRSPLMASPITTVAHVAHDVLQMLMSTDQQDKTEVLRARVEPDLVRAVEQLQRGNNIRSQGEMVRLLIRRGIRAVAEEQDRRLPPALSRDEYAQRAAGFMEALSDLLARIEAHDQDGAVLLAGAIRSAAVAYEADLTKRHTA